MICWSHQAHCKRLLVDEDEEVEQGQPVALCGNTGGWPCSHDHFEIRVNDLSPTFWPKGKTREWVIQNYINPLTFIEEKGGTLPMENDHLGLGWLEVMQDGTIHPGVDLNGPGGCNSDEGTILVSPFPGKVRFARLTPGRGFGYHILIEHDLDEMNELETKRLIKQLIEGKVDKSDFEEFEEGLKDWIEGKLSVEDFKEHQKVTDDLIKKETIQRKDNFAELRKRLLTIEEIVGSLREGLEALGEMELLDIGEEVIDVEDTEEVEKPEVPDVSGGWFARILKLIFRSQSE